MPLTDSMGHTGGDTLVFSALIFIYFIPFLFVVVVVVEEYQFLLF